MRLSSTKPSQFPSTRLHVSVAMQAPSVQLVLQVLVPVAVHVPIVTVHVLITPRTHANASSTRPSQSSSEALHTSLG
jgi:hypothetical protein